MRPQNSADQQDESSKSLGELLVSRRYAAELFGSTEEALDDVALAVVIGINLAVDPPSTLTGNDHFRVVRLNVVYDCFRIESFICNDSPKVEGMQQNYGLRGFVSLAGGQSELYQPAFCIRDDVDLC